MSNEIQLQRDYYTRKAKSYDSSHINTNEHDFLPFYIDFYKLSPLIMMYLSLALSKSEFRLIFHSYPQVRSVCKDIHIINTRNSGINFYKTASHVAMLGVK